jgi:tetratricopeptide (TPR) repeat protein
MDGPPENRGISDAIEVTRQELERTAIPLRACFHGRVTVDNVKLVKLFLRAQNLEHVGRTDEAVELYESVVGAHFDSTGPYDRLIAIYQHQSRHREVARIAEAALARVKTYEDKRAFYERARVEALKAAGRLPQAEPRKPR